MKAHLFYRLLGLHIALLLGICPFLAHALSPTSAQVLQTPAQLSKGGIMFIENVGQFAEGARFLVWGDTYTMWLADDAIWITVLEAPKKDKAGPQFENLREPALAWGNADFRQTLPRRGANIKVTLVGANPHARPEPFNRLSTHVSYFIGNDPGKWHPSVPAWGGVRYKNIYRGMDLELIGDSRHVAPRLVVHPGADLRSVLLRVEGGESLTVGGDQVSIVTTFNTFHIPLLEVVTPSGLSLPQTSSRPTVQETLITAPFAVRPKLRQMEPISSDGPAPESALVYSTFVGGVREDCYWPIHGCSIAADGNGAIYLAGQTYSSDFPTTPGAFDTAFTWDSYILKLDALTGTLDYATFLGGGGREVVFDLAIDKAGNAFVTGDTSSPDFPVTVGALDDTCGINATCDTDPWGYPSGDAFAAVLNATGDSLLYATFIGGAGADIGESLALDDTGTVYVAGIVFYSGEGFPTTPGSLLPTMRGYGNGFIVKLVPRGLGSADLMYGSFIGGSCCEQNVDLAVDDVGNIYITGQTGSADFPTTPGAFGTALHGHVGAFVAKISPDGNGTSDLLYGGLLGGSEDTPSIAVDTEGRIYLAGGTSSPDFPTTEGAFSRTWHGYGSDAFVVQIDPTGAGTADLLYATFLGGQRSESASAIAVDRYGIIYVTGMTNSPDFPTTPDGYSTTLACSTPDQYCDSDVFLIRLSPSGTGSADLLYGTFIGGQFNDEGRAIALDSEGAVYLAGWTTSPDFPTTPNAFDSTCGTDGNCNWSTDAFVTKFILGSEPKSVSATVEPNAEASLLLPDAGGWITFAAGTVTSTTYVTYTQLSSPTYSSREFGYLNRAFMLEATGSDGQPITSFLKPITVTLTYQDTDWQNVGISDESLINLYFWNGSEWQAVLPCSGCSLDTDGNTLIAVLHHLSEFALLVPLGPQLTPITAPTQPVAVNTLINVSAVFRDADSSGPYSAHLEWGDGSSSVGVVSKSNSWWTVTADHIYIAAGIYTIRLIVVDHDDLRGESNFQYAVVYDPNAGFVTGAGWIVLPPGAYTPDPVLSGKANFGFVSRYHKGSNVPTCQTQFRLNVADFNFHSNLCQWLIVAGAKAMYTGTGTVNGIGEYRFLLSVIDGQLPGGGGADKFRMKIWHAATGAVIYDNQIGAADDTDPTTVADGGSIVIHAEK